MNNPVNQLGNQTTQSPLENAAEIIEKFGGIRPMSAKVGVAVTTIQGWKKRGVIPANRAQLVLNAARAHDVDLSATALAVAKVVAVQDLPVQGVTSLPQPKQEIKQEIKIEKAEESEPAQDFIDPPILRYVTPQQPKAQNVEYFVDNSAETSEIEVAPDEIPPENDVSDADDDSDVDSAVENNQEEAETQYAAPKMPPSLEEAMLKGFELEDDDFTEIKVKSERAGMGVVAAVMIGLLILFLIAVVMIMWPQKSVREEVIEVGSSDSLPEEDAADFKGVVPDVGDSEDWGDQIASLTDQAGKATEALGDAARYVKDDVIGENGEKIQDSLNQVGELVEDLSGQDLYAALSSRFESLSDGIGGNGVMDKSMEALHGMLGDLGGGESASVADFNAKLDAARQNDPNLQQAFEGVPPQDLKAAAMLLAMTQMRDTLNRSGVPFEKDLETLLGLTGKDDVELREAITRLAPNAKEGILTPKGVSDEFRSLAGDVVSASLRGEDVSMVERARARMNQVFEVEKGGELVTGTKTQAVVSKAQKELDSGNVKGALDLLQDKLNARELEPLRPWINKAQGVITAGSVEEAINEAIGQKFGSGGKTSKLLKK